MLGTKNASRARDSGIAIAATMAALSLAAHAQDADRLEQMENDIQMIKQRLSKLEGPQVGPAAEKKPSASSEGWKSRSAWRQLKNGMGPSEVRAVLGEPGRLNGGEVAFWYYPNGGVATFMSEKLYQWKEPN